MNSFPIFAHNFEQRMIQRVIGSYDSPAFVRRARRVRESYDYLIAHCQVKREEWLPMPRLHLGMLRALAGDWNCVRPLLANDDQIEVFRALERQLQPRLRVSIGPTSSLRKLGNALGELRESLQKFNRRWSNFLAIVDINPVNEEREGYNRYYLLEKECVLRSPRLARQGFQKLPPLTLVELTSLFPLLAIPEATRLNKKIACGFSALKPQATCKEILEPNS